MKKKNKALYTFFVCSFIFLLSFVDTKSMYNQINSILFQKDSQIVYICEDKEKTNKYKTTEYISKDEQIKYLKSISKELDIKKIGTLLNYQNGKVRINLYNFNDGDNTKEIKSNDFVIRESSYKSIDNTGIYGEYLVNGNVSNFVNRINEDNKFEATIIPKSEYILGFTNDMDILYSAAFIVSSLILLVMICKNKEIYRKKISVYKMFGYSNTKIILAINKKENITGLITAIICFIVFFVVKTYPQFIDFRYFIYLLKPTIIYLAILFTLNLIISTNMVFRVSIKTINKEEKIKYTKVNKVLMSLFTAFAVALVGMFANYFFEYKNRDIGSRLGNNNYVTISTDFRILESRNLGTTFEVMEKQAEEWKLSNEQGGLYLRPGNKPLANITTFEEAKFLDDYVYINNNYLEKIKIYDENGNRIKNIHDDKYTITVLVPERYKGNKEVLKFIKDDHLFRVSEGSIIDKNKNKIKDIKNYKEYLNVRKNESIIEKRYIGKNANKLKENIIYIDGNQKFDSLSNEFPLNDEMIRETNYIISPIAFVINSENFSDMGYMPYAGSGMYFSAINNGYMKFKVDDIKNPEKEVEKILYKTKLLDRFSRIDTIQGMEDRATIMLRKSLITYSILVVLMVIFSLGMIKVDLDEYIESNKKKMGIKYFLGYNRMKIFKSYFSGYALKNIFSFAYILIIWRVFYMYIKMTFYYKMDFTPVILIYVGLVVLEFVYLVIKIRKTDISYIDLK